MRNWTKLLFVMIFLVGMMQLSHAAVDVRSDGTSVGKTEKLNFVGPSVTQSGTVTTIDYTAVTGDTAVTGTLSVSGTMTMSGDSTVAGIGTFAGDVTIGDDLDVNGDLNVDAAIYFPAQAAISGSTTVCIDTAGQIKKVATGCTGS